MIHSSGNRILLGKSGRSSFLFDVDEFHDRLSNSFRACDIRNIWMVDDILIALHCGLRESARPFKNTEEDQDQLHASLIKVLNDNGFTKVAEHFRSSLQNNTLSALEERIESELSKLSSAVSRRQVLTISEKLVSLGYKPESISSLLIREICRLEVQSNDFVSVDELPPESLLSRQLPFDEKFVTWDWQILKFKAVGNLFNSIRIEVNPFELASALDDSPFMEMNFMNQWQGILTEAAAYLETCLLDLESKNLEKIDYFGISVRELDKMSYFCDVSEKSSFVSELYQSLESAFGAVVQQFSDVPIRRN